MSQATLEAPSVAAPAVILLVEDEPVLRSSIARGIGKLPNVEVLAAANYAEALALLDSSVPRVVVSDLDLPDGSGVDLAGELSRRGVCIPVVIVTSHPDGDRGEIPGHSDIIVVEKPVRINDLRLQVTQLLGLSGTEAKSPFSVIDYVQLACLGGHSARIDVDAGEIVATVIVNAGALWSASDRLGGGPAAFHRIAFLTEGVVSLSPLAGDPGPRNIHTRWEIVMMDSARAFDDLCREREGLAPETAVPQPTPARPAKPDGPAGARPGMREPSPRTASPQARMSAGPSASPDGPPAKRRGPAEPDADFEEWWNAGVEALLRRDFPVASRAFLRADAIRPGVPRVVANLQRLREMGVAYEEDSPA